MRFRILQFHQRCKASFSICALAIGRLCFFFVIWSLSAAPEALAQKGGGGGDRGSIGLLGGLAFPTTSSPVLSYGLEGHYRVWNGICTGPFFQRFGVSATIASDTAEATVRMSATYIGVQGLYQFAGGLAGFMAGFRTGVALVERYGLVTSSGTNVLSVDDLIPRFFTTLNVGYHYRIGRFSLGTEIQGLFTFGGVSPMGVLVYFSPKFWF